MFSPFGKVEDVFVHQKPTLGVPNNPPDQFFPEDKDVVRGYRVAYVVFHHPRSLDEILKVNTDEIEHILMGKTRCGLKSNSFHQS
jgi:hypothetical protein